MTNNWIPEWAAYFQIDDTMSGEVRIIFTRENDGHFGQRHPIAQLPAMLSRADVCQQIADRPLADRIEPRNKYDREITPGLWVDVYDVLDAFKVTRSAVAHAVKKLLAPGQRGAKSEIADLKEARDSIDRAIQKLDEWV